MKQAWTYKARDPVGKPVVGEIEADSREYVLESISQRGLIPIKINKKRQGIKLHTLLGNISSSNKENLIIFTKKLKTLHRAGIPLLSALSIIERGADKLKMKSEIKGISSDLKAGESLSCTLAKYPRVFPSIYVNSIAAGETSGSLDEVLNQLAILLEKELVLSRQLKSALRYPILVLSAISAAIFILMSVVIPRFASLYGKYQADLPWPTQLIISISNFMASYWYVILIAAGFVLYGFKKYLATEKGRLRWDSLVNRLPLIGELVIKANIARFATTLRILFSSGIPMVKCMNILCETASNKAIAAEIARMGKSFEAGREIGRSTEEYRYFTAMALEMMDVGLESGSLESIMEELALHYEMELDYKSRHLTAIIEPFLTIILGGMILLLGLAIFLPMWNLIEVFR